VEDSQTWFHKVFKEAGRWPLPDGGEAVLYSSKPDPMPVTDLGIFNMSLTVFEMPNIQARNFQLKALPMSRADSGLGRIKELRIACDSVNYRGIEAGGVSIALVHPQVNLPLYFETQQIELLSLDRLKLKADLNAATLLAYAASKLKWLKSPSITFDGDEIRIKGRAKGLPLEVVASLKIVDQEFVSRLEKVKVGPVRLPLFLFSSVTNYRIPLRPNEETPFALEIGSIEGHGDRLSIWGWEGL